MQTCTNKISESLSTELPNQYISCMSVGNVWWYVYPHVVDELEAKLLLLGAVPFLWKGAVDVLIYNNTPVLNFRKYGVELNIDLYYKMMGYTYE